MHHYQMLKKIDSTKKQMRAEVEERANKVVKHATTAKKSIVDFPLISSYIIQKFPEVDVSHIPIYVSHSSVMDRQKFKGVGGCFIPHMEIILVRSSIHCHVKATNKFDRLMQEATNAKIDMEDVLVHELIHAVSHVANRDGRSFKNNEEEFVYTNCVDFYRQKGISNERIVEDNFLPFCVENVYADTSLMRSVYYRCGIVGAEGCSVTDFNKMLSKRASHLVPQIVLLAKNMGFQMIELYEKYGRGVVLVADEADATQIPTTRFSCLNFEDMEE